MHKRVVIAIKVLVMVLIVRLPLLADTHSDIELFSQKIISSLELTPQSKISVSLLEKDRNYMLDLAPIYELIRAELVKKLSGSQVLFTSIEGRSSSVVYDLLTRQPVDGGVRLKELDTLFLSGDYTIDSDSLIYCTIQLSTSLARTLCSSTFEIQKKDALPSFKAKLFRYVSDKKLKEQTLYRGRVIEAVNAMVNASEGNLFYYPAAFRFVKENPYANVKQLDLLKEVLSYRYGVLFRSDASAKITVSYDGVVLIERDGNSVTLADLVDGEALLPDNFDRDMSKVLVPVRDYKKEEVHYEDRPFRKGESFVPQKIKEIFEVDFPSLFSPLRADSLRSLFYNRENSILVGTLQKSDRATGRETVSYRWSSSEEWITRLEQLQKRGRRFHVSTKVMKVLQDELSATRYWAIIKQDWETYYQGSPVYSDMGFLLVNFDFDMSNHKLKEFKISYRLWFYDYRYKELETGLGRVDKLRYDLEQYFVDPHKGVSGIPINLKEELVSYIVKKADEVDKRIFLQ